MPFLPPNQKCQSTEEVDDGHLQYVFICLSLFLNKILKQHIHCQLFCRLLEGCFVEQNIALNSLSTRILFVETMKFLLTMMFFQLSYAVLLLICCSMLNTWNICNDLQYYMILHKFAIGSIFEKALKIWF